jgi:type IV pilus assembly protein PilV
MRSNDFHRSQRGTTLIEVLVTLVLISVGLLGVAALQLTSLRANQEAYSNSQASALAADILDRMRANQQGVKTGQYAKLGDTKSNLGSEGAAGTNGGADMIAWQASIKAILPGVPQGGVQISADGKVVTVTIQWGERADMTTTDAGANKAHLTQFQTRTEI